MTDGHSTKLHYGKIVGMSMVMCILIFLTDFGLGSILISDSWAGELWLTFVITLLAPIVLGVVLIRSQRKNIGWSVIGGAILILLYRLGSFLLFSGI